MRNNSIAAKVNNLQNDLMNDEEVQNIFKVCLNKSLTFYSKLLLIILILFLGRHTKAKRTIQFKKIQSYERFNCIQYQTIDIVFT